MDLKEDKLRSGLPHPQTLKHDQLHDLIKTGRIKGHVTEKTDGMAFEVGHDEHGPFTRTSNSDRMRHGGGYLEAAQKKFGPGADPKLSGRFEDIHNGLTGNKKLMGYLAKRHAETGQPASFKGEIFHKESGVQSHGKVTFVGTSYDTKHMGGKGMFVAHSKLPENRNHDISHMHTFNDKHFTFDHDIPKTNHTVDVDVSNELKDYHTLNHDLLNSRKTKTNGEAKEAELGKLRGIADRVHSKLFTITSKIEPKWGSEVEGHVIHPHSEHKDAPRIKIMDYEGFRARKAEKGPKFEEYVVILEGGNVKIGEEGSVPITAAKRSSRATDIHQMLHSMNKESNHELFGAGAPALKSGTAYAGSTRHMMNPEISDRDIKKYKPTFGDVDVQVPHTSKETMKGMLAPGKKHGAFTVVGAKGAGNQISAIMKHEDGEQHQVDFEFKHYDPTTHEPTKLSQFIYNSHWDDIKAGIKGANHKMLVHAFNSKDGDRTGIVGGKETRIQTHVLSELGMRAKHIPEMQGSKQKMQDGKPVYTELKPSEATYDTDMHSITSKLLSKNATPKDIEKLHSFHGSMELMKQHFNPDQQRNVIKSYASKIYDKGFKNQPDEVKSLSLNLMRQHFPEHFDKDMERHIAEKKNPETAAKPLKEEKKSGVTVAIAVGRFNGPTKEHEKLINKVFSQKADHHHIFVMGPKTVEQTTSKNPLTIDEKIATLRKLHPDKADSFKSGADPAHKSLYHAISYSYHAHKHEGDVHLKAVGGSGDAGVTKGTGAGGSSDTYTQLTSKYNGKHDKALGHVAMDFKSVESVPNERGTISGSVVRSYARAHNPKNKAHVKEFKSMLHSGLTHDDAHDIFHKMHTRTKNLSEDVYKFLEDVILEYVPTAAERTVRRGQIRKFRVRMDTIKGIKLARTATMDVLQKRSKRNARNSFKAKLARLRGKSYSKLSFSSRMAIDTMLKSRGALIQTTAKRMIPATRNLDISRHRHMHESEARIDKKQLNRKLKIFYAIFDVV